VQRQRPGRFHHNDEGNTMSDLVPGGDTNTGLPEGWIAPWGWPRGGNVGAIWVMPEAATPEDVAGAEKAGWTIDKRSVVGTYSKLWGASQYDETRMELAKLPPCETIGKPGGDGSWTYKSQHLPDEVERVMCEGKWIHNLNGDYVRSSGGEPAKKRDMGHGYWEWEQIDIDIQWDSDLRLWRT